MGQFGSLERWSVALNWQMLPWLQVVLRSGRDETAVPAELISAPEAITPNVPYFDPVRGETVEVTTISGGAANLANESSTINSIGLTATPLRKYRFQFDLTYYQENFANQIGALPFPPGSSVVQAVPDRFVRDADGVLVRVDSRAVNFDRQNTDQLRLGVRFVIPLEAAKRPGRTQTGERRRREPQLSLQFNASQTIILESTATTREGLPEVDLLDGGVIGVGGGLVRNTNRANLGVIKGGSGFRLEYARRGPSNLLLGPADDLQRLRFGALSTLDARLIGDLAQLFPASPLLRGVRVTATLKNAFNERQTVTDPEGLIPQAYNPIRRDPIGRTFMFELRKVF